MLRWTLLGLAFGMFLAGTAAAQSCGCEVSAAKEHEYDELVWLSEEDRQAAVSYHLPWGATNGSSSNEFLLIQSEYLINYDPDLRLATWVANHLTAENLLRERKRIECFRRDVRLPEEQSSGCSDYEEPLFDRGHLVPSGDMTRSEAAMINTYIFSNMAPQYAVFNRGIWAKVEGYVRKWTVTRGHVYVISGAIFDSNGDGMRDADEDATQMRSNNGQERVAVPTHFYKIVTHVRENGFFDTLTILLPHERGGVQGDPDAYLRAHLVTIDEIESLTGIDFLPSVRAIRASKEAAIERFEASHLWPRD